VAEFWHTLIDGKHANVFLQKDICLFLYIQLIEPEIVFAQFMFNNSHAQRSNLEVRDDAMELRETGEAEEYVDDVSCQLGATLPVFTQYTSQCSDRRLCDNNTHSSTLLARDVQAKLALIVAQINPSVHLCVCPWHSLSLWSSL